MTTPAIRSIHVEPSVPLTAEAGGWTEIEGDATAHVETLCETDELWSGVARLGPGTFEYPAAHAGAILVLDGAATVSANLREFFVALTGDET